MTFSRWSARTAQFGLATSALLAVTACAAGGNASVNSFHPQAHAATSITINKAALLHPKRKYYGIFTPSAPASMASIDTITQETGKQPNLSLYFQDWGAGAASGKTDFSTTTAENACAAGLLPMYTWESWNTSDKGTNMHNGASYGTGALWTQPAFSPKKIAAGNFDPYIKATAKLIKSLPCPIAIRFDQEFNGYWYPWGSGNDGMGGTMATRAAAYIKMWRHVWRIFNNVGVSNVVWVWSPNIQSAKHKAEPAYSADYPGNKYVDWVGLDGYYYDAKAGTANNQTFGDVFDPAIKQLTATAPKKPWIIAETGVAAGTHKPAEITNLINSVSTDSRFNGFVYFDQDKANDRSDWRFDAQPTDTNPNLAAFKNAISSKAYANGKPGTL